MTEPKKPTLDLPFDDALKELTGFEIIAVQKHYGVTTLADLGDMRLTIGVVWVYENRTTKVPWATVEAMTLGELTDYFAEASVEPEDDVGKGSLD